MSHFKGELEELRDETSVLRKALLGEEGDGADAEVRYDPIL